LDDKLSILDIKAKLKDGELVNIEVQIANHYNIEKKSLYYWGKTYISQLSPGEQYNKLKKTICINILSFKYFEIENFHSIYHISEDTTGLKMTNDLEIHFIEIPKLEYLKISIENKLVEWSLFLKNPYSLKMEEIMEKEPKIKKAMTVLEFISQDKQARMLYESRQRGLLNYTSDITSAEEKGKLEGKREARIEMAKRLISFGIDLQIIQKSTELSAEEIRDSME
jgi:predicted transposase/invertase (TIGR01784 family)